MRESLCFYLYLSLLQTQRCSQKMPHLECGQEEFVCICGKSSEPAETWFWWVFSDQPGATRTLNGLCPARTKVTESNAPEGDLVHVVLPQRTILIQYFWFLVGNHVQTPGWSQVTPQWLHPIPKGRDPLCLNSEINQRRPTLKGHRNGICWTGTVDDPSVLGTPQDLLRQNRVL